MNLDINPAEPLLFSKRGRTQGPLDVKVLLKTIRTQGPLDVKVLQKQAKRKHCFLAN